MKSSKLTKVVSLVMAIAIIISMAVPFASAAKEPRYGIYKNVATGNLDDKPLPAQSLLTVKAGKTYYFNFQVDSSQKLKWVKVYVAYNDYDTVWEKKDSAQNYMRYTTEFEYTVPKNRKNGDHLQYYFKVRYVDGTTKRFPDGDWWYYAEVK